MAILINTYLRSLSNKYNFKSDPSKAETIDFTILVLQITLELVFENHLKRSCVIGSYDRDTILNEHYDSKADIDLMVIFRTLTKDDKTAVYYELMKAFAKFWVVSFGAEIVKTFPTIALRVDNITYDLVPAIEDDHFWEAKQLILGKGGKWQNTFLSNDKNTLLAANIKYNNIVNHIVRLMKAWNAANNYPYDAYNLESVLVELKYNEDDIQKGFFYAIRSLPLKKNDPQTKRNAVNIIKYNIDQVQIHLTNNNLEKAIHWLHRILPR